MSISWSGLRKIDEYSKSTSYDFVLLYMCSWRLKLWYTIFRGEGTNFAISKNSTSGTSGVHLLFFFSISGFLGPENPMYPNSRSTSKFFPKLTCGPSIVHPRNIKLPGSCSAGLKNPQEEILGQPQGYIEGFSKKIVRHIKKHECFRSGTKKGEAKKWKKCVRGSLRCWVQFVIFLAHHKYVAKNRLEIGSEWVGKNSLKSDG